MKYKWINIIYIVLILISIYILWLNIVNTLNYLSIEKYRIDVYYKDTDEMVILKREAQDTFNSIYQNIAISSVYIVLTIILLLSKFKKRR